MTVRELADALALLPLSLDDAPVSIEVATPRGIYALEIVGLHTERFAVELDVRITGGPGGPRMPWTPKPEE